MQKYFFYISILLLAACERERPEVQGKLVVVQKYFPNKQLMEYREYRNEMKNGRQVAYWNNGNKRFEYTAKNDTYEGELKEWDYNGKLFHLAHYKDGHEEGAQKLWYENGKIRANYVIIKG